MEQATKPLFVGNLAAFVKPQHLTQLFEEKGTVAKIDMKSGFAFIFMPNLEEAEAAAEKFNNYEMEENNRRPLKVEWAKGDGSVKKREDDRKTNAQNNPCETLFVVNFDSRTRERDLEKLFDPFGKSKKPRVEVRKNYAFVQFSTVEEATEARIALNGKLVEDRELTVEYVARQIRNRSRSRSRSPRRRRSRSPPRRSGGGGGGGGSRRGGRDRSRSRSRDRRDRDRDQDRRR